MVIAALVLASPLARLLETAPYAFPALLGFGVLLAWRFRRSRTLFALLIVALASAALISQELSAGSPAHALSLDSREVAPTLQLLGFLLPLNLAALAWLEERGVLTRLGALRLGAILVQAVVVAGVVLTGSGTIESWLSRRLLPEHITAWSTLSDPVLLTFAVAFGPTILRLTLRPDPVTRGLLWALPATFLALDAGVRGDPATVHLTVAAAVLIVSVVESSFAMAYRDGLTGLPSRRAFNEEILKLGGRYTIALLDIDHFKRCNDRYGHDVGDQVLRMVATRLSEVGGGGKAFRYGGEEFAVLFPGKERSECITHLERLREAIKATTFTLRGADRPRRKPKTPRTARIPVKTIRVTASIGVAERTARLPEPEAVIKAADKALYRAKREGRNRVVAASR